MKKYIFVLFLLVSALSLHAQTESQSNLKPGDKVYVDRNCKVYLTGEAIPAWVYDSVLTVQQVGSKKYPNGVLIKEITSWVLPTSLGTTQFQEEQPEPEPEPIDTIPADTLPIIEPEPVVPDTIPEPEPIAPVEVLDTLQDTLPTTPLPVIDTVVNHFVAHHRFGIGLRAGIASLQASVDEREVSGFKTAPGAEGVLDLEYVYYGNPITDGRYQLGIKTGVSFYYTSNKASANDICSSYYLQDDGEGHEMIYTISASNVHEVDRHAMVDIPIMFTLHGANGLTFSVGPRFAIPIFGRYAIHFDSPVIDAYYVDYSVHETNELVTGLVTETTKIGDPTLIAPTVDFQLASELGYEWTLASGDALGLMGYISFSAFYMNLNASETNDLLTATPSPSGAQVDIHSMINSYGFVNGYLNGGIKLSYSFCFPSRK